MAKNYVNKKYKSTRITKSDIIKRVSKATKFAKGDVTVVVNSLADILESCIVNGDNILFGDIEITQLIKPPHIQKLQKTPMGKLSKDLGRVIYSIGEDEYHITHRRRSLKINLFGRSGLLAKEYDKKYIRKTAAEDYEDYKREKGE